MYSNMEIVKSVSESLWVNEVLTQGESHCNLVFVCLFGV